MLTDLGFLNVAVGSVVDTFGGAHGEPNARTFDVNGYAFIARKPGAAAATEADRGV